MSVVELGITTAMRSGPAAAAGTGCEMASKAMAKATVARIDRVRILILNILVVYW
jgi:hypothetical protein